ncbi:hypothetical protein ACFYUY_23760 [Kitasatospora sp. NPDC004745]|uniref:hypothetical protein n=1 Tax=Kitasatospora sp. NPDC004745 TaxID=3364019 RepID=UPI0036B194B2
MGGRQADGQAVGVEGAGGLALAADELRGRVDRPEEDGDQDEVEEWVLRWTAWPGGVTSTGPTTTVSIRMKTAGVLCHTILTG